MSERHYFYDLLCKREGALMREMSLDRRFACGGEAVNLYGEKLLGYAAFESKTRKPKCM